MSGSRETGDTAITALSHCTSNVMYRFVTLASFPNLDPVAKIKSSVVVCGIGFAQEGEAICLLRRRWEAGGQPGGWFAQAVKRGEITACDALISCAALAVSSFMRGRDAAGSMIGFVPDAARLSIRGSKSAEAPKRGMKIYLVIRSGRPVQAYVTKSCAAKAVKDAGPGAGSFHIEEVELDWNWSDQALLGEPVCREP
jgi:hypothetical protein